MCKKQFKKNRFTKQSHVYEGKNMHSLLWTWELTFQNPPCPMISWTICTCPYQIAHTQSVVLTCISHVLKDKFYHSYVILESLQQVLKLGQNSENMHQYHIIMHLLSLREAYCIEWILYLSTLVASSLPHVGTCASKLYGTAHAIWDSTRSLHYMLETHCFKWISNVFDNLLMLSNENGSTNTLAGSYYVDLKKEKKTDIL